MNFKYRLPNHWIDLVSTMEEFANGATQVTIKLKDGREFPRILISNATFIVAARGYDDLPFLLTDIERIFQTPEDRNPGERSGWKYWDEWR